MLTATAAAVVFSQQENKGHFVPETSVGKKKEKKKSCCLSLLCLDKNIEVFLFTLFLEPFHALYSQSLFICRL